MKPNAKLSGIALIAAMGLVSCSTDELQEINAGEGISFTTEVSRATPLTLANLDGFFVYADAKGYPQMFINGMKATKETKSNNIFILDEKVTWPTGVENISFWAYGPLAAENYLTPSITSESQHLQNFTVAQEADNGGENQNDFVVAYTNAKKTPGNQVELKFHHALSQIEIKAKLGDNPEEGRRVKIKGAWLVNINSTGDLQFQESNLDPQYHNMHWAALSGPVTYGRHLADGASLGTEAITLVGNAGNSNSSLMLIPQEKAPYTFSKAATDPSSHEGTAAASESNSTGAYIIVLCRIETHHNTPVTTDGEKQDPAIKIEDNGTSHTHQLFPFTYDKDGKFVYKENAYGYTCVPVKINWIPGKKYVYTLQFCGRGSGAGQYPPTNIPDVLPGGENVITTPETGKNPGDNVLDNEITFKVEVSDWEEAPVDTKMD
ncbi:MAG: fimbrillin family protein [Muribaculum sp.]|nr:fimbrillin family protein [Muribaculum sp.]